MSRGRVALRGISLADNALQRRAGDRSLCFFHLLRQTIFDNRSQNFGDAPGLCKTSARQAWKIAVENFRNVSKACFRQMTRKYLQPLSKLQLRFSAGDLRVRIDERA